MAGGPAAAHTGAAGTHAVSHCTGGALNNLPKVTRGGETAAFKGSAWPPHVSFFPIPRYPLVKRTCKICQDSGSLDFSLEGITVSW